MGRMAGKDVQPFDRKRCPNATYCEPQIGSMGLTEKQAREAGYKVKTGKFPFLGNSKATILGQHEGFIKVVTDEKYGEILGVHAIGPLATEIIAGAGGGAGPRSHARRYGRDHSRASHGLGSDGRRIQRRARA